MKYLFWIMIVISGCARSPNVTQQMQGIYAEVLSTRSGSVYYQRVAARPGVTPELANSRTQAWFNASGRALGTVEETPAQRKSDLLYLVVLPTRPLPADSAGNILTLPPVRFGVTVDNTGDSTRMEATDFEMLNRNGTYQPIETYRATAGLPWVSLWLSDVDAAVTVMLESLIRSVGQPVAP